MTVDDLVELLRAHPKMGVEVLGSSVSVAFLAGTDLAKEFCSVPHFWGFLSATLVSAAAWESVTDVFPMYEYLQGHHSVVFVIQAAQPIGPLPNVCFPEFLSVACRRQCREVFEACNKAAKLEKRAGPLAAYAYGGGTSAINRDADLIRPVTVRLGGSDGKVVTLKKMFLPCAACGKCLKRAEEATVHTVCA